MFGKRGVGEGGREWVGEEIERGEGERERERDRDRQTDRQTDRVKERERERERERDDLFCAVDQSLHAITAIHHSVHILL